MRNECIYDWRSVRKIPNFEALVGTYGYFVDNLDSFGEARFADDGWLMYKGRRIEPLVLERICEDGFVSEEGDVSPYFCSDDGIALREIGR